jgi:hypothetical protein
MRAKLLFATKIAFNVMGLLLLLNAMVYDRPTRHLRYSMQLAVLYVASEVGKKKSLTRSIIYVLILVSFSG